jgi:hypothetical protein
LELCPYCCPVATQQGYPVIVEAWNEPLLLSEIIDAHSFRAHAGEGKKGPTIALWLCFQPDDAPDSTNDTPPLTPRPKEPKKKGKAEAGIKKEIKKEAFDKRPRSASSAELNKSAKRLPVRQGNAAMQAGAMEQVEEDLLHTGDDVEDDLPPPRATHAT